MFGAVILFLASCLKQGTMNTDPANASNVVEFANTGSNSTVSGVPEFYSDLGVLSAGGSKTFNINVHYAGVGTAPSDITVTLAIDAATLASYNATNGTAKEVPAATVYNFPTSVVIKQGTNQTTIKATVVVSADFNFNKAYAIPLKIASVSSGIISANYGSAVYSFGVRNKFDGVYQLKGHHNRVPYNYPYDVTMSMMTLGVSSVGFYFDDAGSWGHPIGTSSGVSWYGAAISPVIVFDAATDLVASVFNQGGATPITMYTGAGSGVSRFDPATHNIYVYWNYNNNPARAFFDTLNYIGPR